MAADSESKGGGLRLGSTAGHEWRGEGVGRPTL
jgi:hypothetical protein